MQTICIAHALQISSILTSIAVKDVIRKKQNYIPNASKVSKVIIYY